MTIRYVPGLGELEFPAGTTEDEMRAAIEREYQRIGLHAIPRPSADASAAEKEQYIAMLEQAGQQALSQPSPAAQDAADMGFMERRRLGVGKGAQDVWLGAQQLFAGDQRQQEIQSQLADSERAYNYIRQQDPVAAPISEILGNVAATTPAMLVPGGQGVLSNTASLGVQGALAGAVQPAYGDDLVSQKAGNAALGGGIGAGFGVVPAIVGGTVRGVRQFMNPYQPTPTSGLADSVRVGRMAEQAMPDAPPLTPGQLADDPGMVAVENAARQGPYTRASVAETDQLQTEGARESIANFARRIGNINADKAGAGAAIRRTVNDYVIKLRGARRAESKPLYDEAHRLSGGRPVVTATNYRQALNDIIEEYEGVDSPEARRIVRQAMAKLQNSGEAFTVNDAIRTRSFAGRAARGRASMFDEVEQGTQRDISARLHRALTQDLEQMGGDEALGELFTRANRVYRDYSASMEAVENSAIGRLMGREFEDALQVMGDDAINTIAPERVYERLIKMPPSDIESAVNLLNRQNPQVARDLRAAVIMRSLDDAGVGRLPTNEAGAQQWSGARYMRSLPDSERLHALGFTRSEMREMAGQMDYLRRIGDRTGMNFSNTEAQGALREAITAFQSFKNWISGKVLDAAVMRRYMEGVSRAMADPKGREGIRALSVANSPEDIAAAMRSLPQLVAVSRAESAAARATIPAVTN